MAQKKKKAAKAQKVKVEKVEVGLVQSQKVEAVKAVTVAVTTVATDDMVKLRELARQNFGLMQRSWFEFAKSVHAIRSQDAFAAFGHETFRDFCAAEYPTVNFSTIIKFTAIVDGWGKTIESRMSSDPGYTLPAYESCYQLVTVEGKMPKEEINKLKRQVLDAKLSYAALRDKVKESIDAVGKRSREEADVDVAEAEAQLAKDIEGESDEFLEAKGAIGESLNDDAESDLSVRVRSLREHLTEAIRRIKKAEEVSEEMVEIAEEVEALNEVSEDFLKTVEEVSNG